MSPGDTEIIHLRLCELFPHLLDFFESGYPTISIFYRIQSEGNVVRTASKGHKILCHDMPPAQRKLFRALQGLHLAHKIVVITKHMPPPLKDDGKPAYVTWDNKEMAHYLCINGGAGSFKSRYEAALKKLQKAL
jgi:hypothetical protein